MDANERIRLASVPREVMVEAAHPGVQPYNVAMSLSTSSTWPSTVTWG
jgi:hypothetical protein